MRNNTWRFWSRTQLADALSILHKLPSAKLQELLPDTISAGLVHDFLWRHDEIQSELDKLVVKDHDDLYDLSRIPDQQDKVTLLSTDTSDTEITNSQGFERGSCVSRKTTFWKVATQLHSKILSQFVTKHRKTLRCTVGLA